MNKRNINFIVTIVLIGAAYSRDLPKSSPADEAQVELNKLRNNITAAIQIATLNLDIIFNNINNTSQDVYADGDKTIDAIHSTVISMLDQIKTTAEEEGKDISLCIEVPEKQIHSIPVEAKLQLRGCIDDVIFHSFGISLAAYYKVDVSINKVGQLQLALTGCKGDSECVGFLIESIEKAKTDINKEISDEVDKAEADVIIEDRKIHQCADRQIPEYNLRMDAAINAASDCIQNA